MKNWTLLIVALVSSFGALAQRTDEPVYYTDGNVEKKIASFGLHYDPLFTQRRLFSLNQGGVNANYNEDDYPATGGYGHTWGGYVNFSINSNLKLGIGAGQTLISYRLDNYDYVVGSDTTKVGLNTRGVYNTFPLRVGFATPMNDAWDLEIWIPIAYNKLVSYNESTTLNGAAVNNDLTDDAKSAIWSVAIQVGGAFYFTDKWAVTGAAQFRYFTTPIIEKDNRPIETPYGVGLTLGLRYSL